MRRRATVALGAVLVAVVATAVWAMWPISDSLGRDCGGGVFGTSVDREKDDTYLEPCNTLRDDRQGAVEVLGIMVGLALVGVGSWTARAVSDHPAELDRRRHP